MTMRTATGGAKHTNKVNVEVARSRGHISGHALMHEMDVLGHTRTCLIAASGCGESCRFRTARAAWAALWRQASGIGGRLAERPEASQGQQYMYSRLTCRRQSQGTRGGPRHESGPSLHTQLRRGPPATSWINKVLEPAVPRTLIASTSTNSWPSSRLTRLTFRVIHRHPCLQRRSRAAGSSPPDRDRHRADGAPHGICKPAGLGERAATRGSAEFRCAPLAPPGSSGLRRAPPCSAAFCPAPPSSAILCRALPSSARPRRTACRQTTTHFHSIDPQFNPRVDRPCGPDRQS